MSESTRRNSRVARLMLTAVALLGFGAAITAAAWEDHVYFEIEATAATFDVQGRIGLAEDSWEAGDADLEDGWAQSQDAGNITLTASFANLIPGDSRDFYVQLRNIGTVTAYVDLASSDVVWSGDGSCFGVDGADVTTIDDPSGLLEIAGGTSSDVYHLTLSVPDDWSDSCQGASASWTISLHYTTDAS